MHRHTSQLAVKKIGSKFDLVLIAGIRARELLNGAQPLVNTKDGAIVTALKEIEDGLIGREYLNKIK